MKQIIYLGGKKARNYTAPHEETDVIGDCDWKKGEVKTAGVDYFEHPWGINAIVTPVPIPKKQEGESAATPPDVEQMAEESAGGLTNEGTTFERAEHIAGFKAGYQAGQSAVQDATKKPDPEKYTVRGPHDQLDFDGASYEDALRKSQDATPQEWEKSVKRYVMEELWGFDPIQEEAGLSERLRNELKNFVEAINHFTATLRSSLSAAQEENKKLREGRSNATE